ncbi:1,4-alpha-glucan branching protein GlgB [Microbacterium album]|uniref:1,4-alpha-glucan branching enzyme GlgB n=1 Tax=Microbacterium album TaxID=2053191 RepID=A0A917MNN9_9MICO|nr:1,4-alpha-glucan branching protein GlgB [Microbacterium album]GGH42486.1 1,4-alpha-glucan branching enzyme GlgB [Microbacterium album]
MTAAEILPVDRATIESVAAGVHADPHAVLGPHPHAGGVTVRVLRPLASSVAVRYRLEAPTRRAPDGWAEIQLAHEHEGVWAGVLPVADVPAYRVVAAYGEGDARTSVVRDDPYRFLPTLGEVDLHLIGEGRHEMLWRVLGAHVHRYDAWGDTVTGTAFAVWAPRARAVRIKADFNDWDGREHPMRTLGSSGVWELFVPDVGSGTRYKFVVLGADGVWREKADPMAAYAEVPPDTASIVHESSYEWGDEEWLRRRAHDQAEGRGHVARPMAIYEVHLGSWRRGLTYEQLAEQLPSYVSDLGFTHVELMPVMQHPFGGSWGYHVTSYYAPDSRFGDPDGLRLLIDRLHQAGVGVILDWVPGHFATDEWALARFDGAPLYEDPNPQRGWHKEWGSHIFDFGNPPVRNFLYANAVYWLEEFHADGLRVDGVASMLYLDYARDPGEWSPNVHGGHENLEAVQFLQEMNATVYRRVPGILTIAEESTSWPGVTRPTSAGGLGFGFKWNMGWMHDTLGYIGRDPVHRAHHHHDMTFSLTYAWSENYVLPLSHDEVVHGKGSLLRKAPGDRWRQLATLRAYLAFMWAHPGKQLLFMGSEFGQESEWAESRELDWWLLDLPDHRGVQQAVRDINTRYRETPALWALDDDPAGFRWLQADDAGGNVLAFARLDGRDVEEPGAALVSVTNFAAMPHERYRLGFPAPGVWDEVLNTDAVGYAGSGVGNLGAVEVEPAPHAGHPASAEVTLPPLATVWFRLRG